LYHTYLDEAMWKEIQDSRQNINFIENDIQKQNAYSLYRASKRLFQKGQACLEPTPTCAPKFKRQIYPVSTSKLF
jgi:hypothetical protein